MKYFFKVRCNMAVKNLLKIEEDYMQKWFNNLLKFLWLHNSESWSHCHLQTNIPPLFRLAGFLTLQIYKQVEWTWEACHLCLRQ